MPEFNEVLRKFIIIRKTLQDIFSKPNAYSLFKPQGSTEHRYDECKQQTILENYDEKTNMRDCVLLFDIYTLGVDKQAQIVSQLNRKSD